MTPETSHLIAGLRLGTPQALSRLRAALRAARGAQPEACKALGFSRQLLHDLTQESAPVAEVVRKYSRKPGRPKKST